MHTYTKTAKGEGGKQDGMGIGFAIYQELDHLFLNIFFSFACTYMCVDMYAP